MKVIVTVGIALALLFLVLSAALGLIGLWSRVTGLHRERELEILRQLEMHGESFGLDLILRSNGLLQRGRIYAMLDDLERRGLLRSQVVPAQIGLYPVSRRMFRISDQGIDHLKQSGASSP
jgi:hypothetical protein